MNIFAQKNRHILSNLNRWYRLKISFLAFVLLFISACGTAENKDSAEGMATLSVTIPGLTVNRQSQKSTAALRAGVPDEVTSILIEVLNDKSILLDSAEVIGTDGTVILTISEGENFTIRGSAFAGPELLFLGESNVPVIRAGSNSSVSLTLQDQITLSLTSPGDIEVGVGETGINFTLTGLNDIALRWYVNGIANGSSEFGFIDITGKYTAPALLPTNPVITITAEPVVSPSFAQSFSFNLLPVNNVNNDPVANAGADQSVMENSSVSLDGAASNDNDGSIDSYSWSVVTGSGVTLNNPSSVNPDFTAPDVSSNQTFVFQLTVTDNEGASSSDTVSITVTPLPNITPVANAGADQTVNAGEVVTLSAAASSDVDGTIVGYSWLQVSEDVFPVISNTDQSIASFVAPSLSRDSVVVLELTVTDNDGAIHSDSITISILRVPNILPVANAGEDLTVNEQTTVTLNGSASDDSDGSVSDYSWLQTSGASVTLSDASIDSPQFTAPTLTVEDMLVFELTVTDNEGASHADSVSITVQPVNTDPVANAGTDLIVNAAVLVNLLATSSSDADGSIVAYSWTQISSDLSPVLNNADTESPSFTSPSVQYGGFVTYRLTVTDNEGATATDEVTITVNGTDQPLVANAGLDQVVSENTLVTLNALLSDDPDNNITTYLWEEMTNGGLVLSDNSAQQPTFMSPDITTDSDYQFRLTVTNDHGDQAQDTVTITVNNVLAVANKVYFAATSDFSSHTIWVTDGTDAGTQEVAAIITSNYDFVGFKTVGDFFYFSGDDGVNGRELWRTDGTLLATEMFASAPDAAYVGQGAVAGAEPSAFSVINDNLLYRAVISSVNGSNKISEYLSLDTTSKNLTTLSTSGVSSFSNNQVGVFNGFSYFYKMNSTPVISTTLYKTDGVNTAVTVKSFLQFDDIHDFTEVNGELFFILGSNELWKSDGTEAGTVLLKIFSGFAGTSGNFEGSKNLIAYNNKLFFVADDGEGRELWVSDGTVPGTVILKDLDSTIASSNPTEFNIINGKLLFLSSEAAGSTDGVWVSDGSAIGTQRIASVSVNTDVNYYDGKPTAVSMFVDSLNLMFFTANDGSNGSEIWVTDGTPTGTKMVMDINPSGDSEPAMFRPGNGFLIFSAQDADFRARLWKTDGTETGTTMIKDINPGGFGNSAFFSLGG